MDIHLAPPVQLENINNSLVKNHAYLVHQGTLPRNLGQKAFSNVSPTLVLLLLLLLLKPVSIYNNLFSYYARLPYSADPAKTVTDNFFTSPNYPNNYPVLQKRTYLLQCNNNLKLTIMILDLSLASGDSLTVHGASYRGATHLTVPEAKVYSFSNTNVTFISDGRNTRKGFRIVYGCYCKWVVAWTLTNSSDLIAVNKYVSYLNDLAIDCEVRKYLKVRNVLCCISTSIPYMIWCHYILIVSLCL